MLAADNSAQLCSRCHREHRDQLHAPPAHLRNEFFDTDEFRAAFESQQIGKVFKVYRNHHRHLKLLGKALNQETLGRWLGLTQAQVSKIENGKPEQNLETLRHYARILHLPQHLLWFDLPGQSRLTPLESSHPAGSSIVPAPGDDTVVVSEGGPVRRRTLLGGVAGEVAAEMLSGTGETAEGLHELFGRVREAGGVPRVGKHETETLREAIDDLYSLDAYLGGDRLWRLALAQLRWVEAVVNNCSYSDTTGDELHRMVGELKTSVGWYSFDAGMQQQARQYFSEGLNLAYLADDHLLIVRTLANMARQAVHLGRPREAVLLAQRGHENFGKLITPRIRSLLAIREAQGWAALRQDTSYSEAIGRAQSNFARGFAERDPEWVMFFTEAEFSALEGMCRSDLGHYDVAQELLETSFELHADGTDGFRRNMGIGLARLSLNWLRKGDLERSATVAKEAALVATEIRSTRMSGELSALARSLAPHQGLPAIDDAVRSIALLA